LFVFAPEISLISGFLDNFPGQSVFFSLKNCSFIFILILKVLDLELGKLVSSVHGREVLSIKKIISKCILMLKVLDLGFGKLVSSVFSINK
jgi:hypothetical protein